MTRALAAGILAAFVLAVLLLTGALPALEAAARSFLP